MTGRVRIPATVLAVAALLAGCGTKEDIRRGGTVLGETLTVYSSLPEPSRGAAHDIVDGEKLALAQAQGRAAAYKVNYSSLDEGAGDPAEASARVAGVARQELLDTQTIAVIGSLDSEAAMSSIPLLNAGGILQVSPGSGYAGFTERVAPGEPERWFPAGRTTFARIVGDDRAQAGAMLAAGGARRVVIEAEATPTARALAGELRRAAAGAGVRIVEDAARAGAVLYAGEDPENAAGVADGIAREAPRARVVLPDAVTRAGVEQRLQAGAARRAVLVSSAPEPGSTPDLRRFEAVFRQRFGRAPGPYAAVGHAAMHSVLDAITRAGPRAGSRQAVIDAFFRRPALATVLGPVRFRPSGAIATARFSAYRLRGGRRVYRRVG
jgi:branched-chain amino acid transport system substrate-binding protein